MIKTLPTLTDEEVARCPAPADQGFGSLSSERGPLPLKAMDVQARIDGLVVQIDLQQTFVNTHSEALEATYIFPLPDRAAVTRFRLEVAGRVVEGELKERGAARQEYDKAIKAGHRAAITEEERPGVFTMRVGNLPAGETARVRLSLAGPLPFSDGEATFRFPLVVAPRYIPGNPLPGPSVGEGVSADTDAVPDASRISPPVLLAGYPNPVRLSLRVDFDSSVPVEEIRSSLHSILEEANYPIRRVVVQPGERLNRDFILRFRLAGDSIRTSLSLWPDRDEREGTWMLTLVPPLARGGASRPRDVVFVLDRSGSMGGWKIVAARRAMGRMVDTLTDRDRFTVMAFDDRIEQPAEFAGQLVSGLDRHRFQALEFLARIDARGGTEMAEPLARAVQELTKDVSKDRDRVLVLVTDGQVGNEDQILPHLGPAAKNIRIFTLGIDQAVNAAFLRRLSDLGGGASEVVESEERLDEVMDQVHRHIGTPLLTGLRLEPAGLNVVPGSVVPARLPDLFAGTPLVILGRFQGLPRGAIALQARDGTGQMWSSEVAGRDGGNPALASVWGRGRLRELEDRYVIASGDRSGLEREIVGVSLRFGVMCRFTSFVAVDRSEVVNQGGQIYGLVQPVEQPAGWQVCGAVPACAPAPMAAGPVGAARAATPMMLAKQVLPPLAPDDKDAGSDRMERSLGRFRDSAGEVPAVASVEERVIDIVCENLGVNKEQVTRQTSFQEDVGADSLDIVELVMELEEAFEITIPDDQAEKIKTVGEAINYIARATTRPSVDREQFRPRVTALLQAMTGCPSVLPAHRLDLLRSLSPKLGQLFQDLCNAGDQHPSVKRLGEKVLELQSLLVEPRPTDKAINNLWTAMETVLKEYLESLGQPPDAGQPARREGFWK